MEIPSTVIETYICSSCRCPTPVVTRAVRVLTVELESKTEAIQNLETELIKSEINISSPCLLPIPDITDFEDQHYVQDPTLSSKVKDKDFSSTDSNSENSSPKKASNTPMKRLKSVNEAASRKSDLKFTSDNDLIKSASNASSFKSVKCKETSSLVNEKVIHPEAKQETNNKELEDSTDKISQNPYKSKVTFKKEIETAISKKIDNGLKVVNQNTGNSNNLTIEMLSPSTQQLKSDQYYEIIVGSKSLLEPVSDRDNKPQASSSSSYKCDICSTDLGNASALTAHKTKEHRDAKVRCPDPTCDYTAEFSSRAQLDDHYKKRHGLKCALCDSIFLSNSRLNKHLAIEHKVEEPPGPSLAEDKVMEVLEPAAQRVESAEFETSRVCWICGAVFKSNVYLDKHIVTMHWEKKHVCVICDKRFPTEMALKKHVKIHDPDHKVKRFFCQHCPKSFWSKYSMKEHILVHASLKPYVCETCGFGFVRKRNLVRHRDMRNMMGFCPKPKKKKSSSLNIENLNVSNSQSQVCLKSNIKQTDVSSLKTENSNLANSQSQVRFTSNIQKIVCKKFKCDICQRNFIRKNNYDRHVKYHFCNGDPEIIKKLLEEPEIQECGICKRVLLSKISLQLHVSSHTNSTKPFQCEFCEKSFSVANEYRVHERLHTGEAPFQCSHCGQTFSRKSRLEIHETKHSDEKPFECPICQKTFKRRKLLLNHTFIHKEASRAIRPYHCTRCWKGFLTQQHLKNHMKSHDQGTAADWFHCAHCGKKFKLFKSLKRHIQTKHITDAAIFEIIEEGVEHEQEDNSAFQFLNFVENEEVVEDEQCENFPFVVVADECVVSS